MDRFLEPLEIELRQRFSRHSITHEMERLGREQDLALSRRLFEPSRQVHRGTRDIGVGIRGRARDYLPRGEAGSGRSVTPRSRSSSSLRPAATSRISTAARTARTASSSWSDRRAEHRHHRVTDEFLDLATVMLDHTPRVVEVPCQEALDRFGIEGVGECRRVNDVTEEGGDQFARFSGSGRCQRFPARGAEAGVRRVVGRALSAGQHGPERMLIGAATSGWFSYRRRIRRRNTLRRRGGGAENPG